MVNEADEVVYINIEGPTSEGDELEVKPWKAKRVELGRQVESVVQLAKMLGDDMAYEVVASSLRAAENGPIVTIMASPRAVIRIYDPVFPTHLEKAVALAEQMMKNSWPKEVNDSRHTYINLALPKGCNDVFEMEKLTKDVFKILCRFYAYARFDFSVAQTTCGTTMYAQIPAELALDTVSIACHNVVAPPDGRLN